MSFPVSLILALLTPSVPGPQSSEHLQNLGRLLQQRQQLGGIPAGPGVCSAELHRSRPHWHPDLLQPSSREAHGATEREHRRHGTGASRTREHRWDAQRGGPAARAGVFLLVRTVAELAVPAAQGAAGVSERLRCWLPSHYCRQLRRWLSQQLSGWNAVLAGFPRPRDGRDLCQPER